MSSTQLTIPHARARRARAARLAPDALWAPGDRIVAALVIAVGVGLIAVAWFGASDTTDWNTQLRWTALSMVGVVVACVGVGIWLFRGFARVRGEAREVRRLLAPRVARRAPSVEADIFNERRVTVAGMAHHHSADCLLVSGKTVVGADVAALAPCGVCA